MERHLFDVLVRYGAPVLFFAQMFGIFGLPIPDELLLTIAGVLIRRGQLDGEATLTAAVTGCIAGITLSYLLGRVVGVAALRRIVRVHTGALLRAETWFRQFGKWVLAIGYFVPGVRHVTAIAAGSVPLEFDEFAAYAYPGAVIWSSTFIGLGYYAGDRWEQAAAALRSHLALLAVAVGALAAVYIVVRRWTATSERPA